MVLGPPGDTASRGLVLVPFPGPWASRRWSHQGTSRGAGAGALTQGRTQGGLNHSGAEPSSIEEWVDEEIGSVHIVGCHAALRRKRTLTYAVTCMNWEDFLPSGRVRDGK